jgi:hypothetical protein
MINDESIDNALSFNCQLKVDFLIKLVFIILLKPSFELNDKELTYSLFIIHDASFFNGYAAIKPRGGDFVIRKFGHIILRTFVALNRQTAQGIIKIFGRFLG